MWGTRRDFLSTSVGAGATLFSAPVFLRGDSPNETITVAVLGSGGRSIRLLKSLLKISNVRVKTLCDIWEPARLRAAALLKDQPGQLQHSTEYQAVLDDPEIEGVIIASPDHWHTQMTIDACNAGKDVYVEKPLTHSRDDGQLIIEAEQRNKRIVQVGTQQRSMPHLIEAREIIRSGELGPIRKVHMSWNRNSTRGKSLDYGISAGDLNWKKFLGSAPDQPFDQYRFRNWRFFWDFGGGIFTDLMVHWLDAAYWMLDMDLPATAMSIGDQFQTQGLWETPDSVQTLLHFPNQGLQAYFEGTFVNHRNRAMLELMGTEATMYCDRGRYEIHPERGKKVKARERVDGMSTDIRGANFYEDVDGAHHHLQNWLDCMRSRKTPVCSAAEGVRSAAAAHMANQSLRSGQVTRS